MTNQTLLLACLGLSLSQIKRIKEDAKEGVHHFIKEKIRRLTCDFDLDKNCFAQLAFAAQYDTSKQEKLPMYLQEKNFITIRQNTHRILSQKSSMTQFLKSQTDGSIDAFVLNDIQDRLNKMEILSLWTEINRTATSGAKVLFRSITSNLNLEQQLPPTLLDDWKTDQNQNTHLLQSDRSAIYNSICLYTKNS
jgi:S-adenosylmethionine-diacylglycerol 3-amino-3-carboxypropyl transferase